MGDFGLAVMFDGKDFKCNRYVGKCGYQAPKVHAGKLFDARAADMWSLGVVLFMLTVGSAPFKRPVRSEFGYHMIADGKIVHLLSCWHRLGYVTQPMLEVLYRLLRTDEAKRINAKGVLDHPWLKSEEDD